MKILCWTTGTLLTIWFVSANAAVLAILCSMSDAVGVSGVPEAGFAEMHVFFAPFSLAIVIPVFVAPAYYCLYRHYVACKNFREAIFADILNQKMHAAEEKKLRMTEYILLGIVSFYIFLMVCAYPPAFEAICKPLRAIQFRSSVVPR